MRTIASSLPEWIKKPLRRLGDVARAASYLSYYGRGRLCPVCGKSSRRFRQYGLAPREDAECVSCGALERHRFVWLYVFIKTNLFDGTPKRMLHVAPERCLESRFRQRLGEGYLTADLSNTRAMMNMDVTNIEYPDESFDVIYCSHVLEHVQGDRKAIREFYRVLRSNGWAILLVPITAKRTFEDPSMVEPAERLKAFGKEDHVRRYGPDFVDRLREADFNVEVVKVNDLVRKDEAVTMGLTTASGEIYYCTK